MDFTRTIKYTNVTATVVNKAEKKIETMQIPIDGFFKDEKKLAKEVEKTIPSGYTLVSIDKVTTSKEIRSIPFSVFMENSKVITR